jgi:hypothetical protein
VSSVRLLGLDYDPKAETFEVLLENVDHLVFQPREIWILEGEPGFVSTIEIVQADGTKQIIYIRTHAPMAPPAGTPSSRSAAARR